MQVTVKWIGPVPEASGPKELGARLPDGARLRDLADLLAREHEAFAAMASRLRAALATAKGGQKRAEQAFEWVLETLDDLFNERDPEEKVWGSMVKQTLKRRKPGFNERYHGFRSFSELLEQMKEQKIHAGTRPEIGWQYHYRLCRRLRSLRIFARRPDFKDSIFRADLFTDKKRPVLRRVLFLAGRSVVLAQIPTFPYVDHDADPLRPSDHP